MYPCPSDDGSPVLLGGQPGFFTVITSLDYWERHDESQDTCHLALPLRLTSNVNVLTLTSCPPKMTRKRQQLYAGTAIKFSVHETKRPMAGGYKSGR